MRDWRSSILCCREGCKSSGRAVTRSSVHFMFTLCSLTMFSKARTFWRLVCRSCSFSFSDSNWSLTLSSFCCWIRSWILWTSSLCLSCSMRANSSVWAASYWLCLIVSSAATLAAVRSSYLFCSSLVVSLSILEVKRSCLISTILAL